MADTDDEKLAGVKRAIEVMHDFVIDCVGKITRDPTAKAVLVSALIIKLTATMTEWGAAPLNDEEE